MKLESLGSYKRDAMTTKMILFICVLLCVAATVYMYIDSRNFIEKQSSKKIVIDKENHSWLATEKILTRDDRKIQYEEHIKDFYRLFFAFDGNTFDSTVNHALNLMEGELGKKLYIKTYVEQPLAREVTEHNWILKIEIQKVECDVSVSPAKGIIYAKQILKRPAGEVVRNMNATFVIDDANISYKNPRGALIIAFDIFDNSRVKQ